MAFRAICTERLADLVTVQLKEAIFRGEYKSGQKLPPETQLVEIFGVSRMVVREAIRNLELSGLIEIKRGHMGGAFVLSVRHHSVFNVFKDMLRLSDARVADIMEVRLGIEPIVAGLAATRRTEEDIDRLSQNLQQKHDYHRSIEQHLAWNLNFHRLVAQASHNTVYDILVNLLLDITMHFWMPMLPRDKPLHDTTSHPAILERIEKKDAEGARKIFVEHMEVLVPKMNKVEKKWRQAGARRDK